jgi:hypothetical protein
MTCLHGIYGIIARNTAVDFVTRRSLGKRQLQNFPWFGKGRDILSTTGRLSLGLLLCVATAAGQPTTDDQIIAKLVSDLLPLKLAVASDDPLKDDIYTPTELQPVETYSESQAMKVFGKRPDRTPTETFPPRRSAAMAGENAFRPFIGPDQAYKLGYVLTGKDLTQANLAPLVEELVGIQGRAAECSNTRVPPQNSADFRTSAEKARNALGALGLSNRDIHIEMDSLFSGAIAAASPPPTFKYQ